MGTWQGREALIFSGAPESDLDYVRKLYMQLQQPVVVCADGGVRFVQALGLRPDLVVADFDSADEPANCAEVIRLPAEKDDTDTQHCVKEAIVRGCTRLSMVCALGGRTDHMLANLALCEYAWEQGAELTIFDRQNCIRFHGGGNLHFSNAMGKKYISLVPLDRRLEGVTMKGLKYPLDCAVLTRSLMISISNEQAAPGFQIEIASGRALIIFCDDAS